MDATASPAADSLDEGSSVRLAERGRLQANRVTVTKFCRCNYSSRDDLVRHFRPTDVVD
jgi:hypothetical protein